MRFPGAIKTLEEAVVALERVGTLRIAVQVVLEKLDNKIKTDKREIEFFNEAARLLDILAKSDTKNPERARVLAELVVQRRGKEEDEISEMRSMGEYLVEIKDRLDRFAEELRKK